MLTEALLIALLAGIAGMDLYNGLTHMHRPLVTGVLVGLILGDVQTGLITGGTLELVWMGMAPLAGAQPPNVVIGGIIGAAFAILTNSDPKVAVGIAVPFAVAAQAGVTLLFTIMAPLMHKADEYAEEANLSGIAKINYAGLAILFVSHALVAFLPIYLGADAAEAAVASLPQTFIDGLSVAGGMMPAIGFALLLKVMFQKEYTGFLILGFVLVAYLELPILAVALIGTAIALYDYFKNQGNNNSSVTTNNEEVMTDGI